MAGAVRPKCGGPPPPPPRLAGARSQALAIWNRCRSTGGTPSPRPGSGSRLAVHDALLASPSAGAGLDRARIGGMELARALPAVASSPPAGAGEPRSCRTRLCRFRPPVVRRADPHLGAVLVPRLANQSPSPPAPPCRGDRRQDPRVGRAETRPRPGPLLAAGRGRRSPLLRGRVGRMSAGQSFRSPQAVLVAAAPSSPSSATEISRILNFCTLPVTVRGNSSVSRRYRGILKWAMRPWQNSRSSSMDRL